MSGTVELPGYTKWIFGVVKELGITPEEGEHYFRDPNWFFCYDDGMTPSEAIAEARSKGVLENMSGHYIELCTECGTVISQCRCPDPNKTKRYSVCDKCKTVEKLKGELNAGEKLFVEHMRGLNGSFYTKLFEAAMAADNTNLAKMENGFPLEIQAVRRYKNELGYWEDLEERYDNSL